MADRILLIRHGETGWNREEIFRGRADIPLSERGLQQAEATAQALASLKLCAVVSSPLSRAVETARPIADLHGLTLIPEPDLIDMDFGEWEGVPRAEVERRYPDQYAAWASRPHQAAPPGGEPLSQVLERSLAALDRWEEQHPKGVLALVTHRVVCKLLACTALGMDESAFWRVRVDTCSISSLERAPDGNRSLSLLNDTCHRRAVPAPRLPDF